MSIDGVTPAPSTVDRALFDEMVEAVQGVLLWRTGTLKTGRGDIRDTDASRSAIDHLAEVLSKVREASK